MRVKTIALYFLIVCLLLSGTLLCSSDNNKDDTEKYEFTQCTDIAEDVTDVSAAPATSVLPANPKWAYMIQNDVTSEISGTNFDVLVMDYTKDGTEDEGQTYTAAEMNTIKTNGADRKAIAYLSIGEAEDYRWYFDSTWTDDGDDGQPDSDAPCWLNKTNPEWEGNYKVQYWSEEWQQIILAYVDRIIGYGFDGVYLDIIDGFEYWCDSENGEGFTLTEEEAATRMCNFVKRIAYHARVTNDLPDFIIMPQNGEGILDYDSNGEYLSVINGIGIEDLFYDERTANDTATINERIEYLDQINTDDRKIIVVDYVYDGSKDSVVNDFISKVNAKGYFPYAARTDRELDDLVIFDGQGQ